MVAPLQSILFRKHEGRPHLNRAVQRGQFGWHYANDGVLLSVKSNLLVNNAGIRSEVAPPKVIAKYDYALPACNVLAGQKAAAQSRFHSQHVKIVCTHV